MQILAFDFWNGTPDLVRTFIGDNRVTYPILLDAGFLAASGSYGIRYDNYVVVDPQGFVRYTSVNEAYTGLGRWNDAAVRSIVEQHLPTPVAARTWAKMKALYQ